MALSWPRSMVDLTLVIGDSLSDGDKGAIRTLEVEVKSSVESWYKVFNVSGQFGGRKAQIVYRPKVQSGRLAFDVRVRGDMGQLIGAGHDDVDLKPGGTVDVTADIERPAPYDMLPPPDFLPGPDLVGADLATPPPPPPDLAMPPRPKRDLAMPQPNPDLATPPAPNDLSAIDGP